jgi:Na+/H+-translocating membrane pyrophosphatase
VTFSQIFIILILIIPLIFVFLNKLREDVAAMLMAVSLGIAQYLGMGIVGPQTHHRLVECITGSAPRSDHIDFCSYSLHP